RQEPSFLEALQREYEKNKQECRRHEAEIRGLREENVALQQKERELRAGAQQRKEEQRQLKGEICQLREELAAQEQEFNHHWANTAAQLARETREALLSEMAELVTRTAELRSRAWLLLW